MNGNEIAICPYCEQDTAGNHEAGCPMAYPEVYR